MKKLDRTQLEETTVAELREICKNFGITGMSKARKDDIIDAIEDYYEDNYEDEYVADDTDEPNEEKVPYINAQVHSFLQNNEYKSLISVSCGAASSNYPVVGKTVGFVKATYREILNIDTESMSVVNGENTPDSYTLKSGDVLEFVRTAGTKG